MQNVIIVIHLMVVTALVIVVLLQRSEGGALGIGGGGGVMTGRGQANALTRATAILATIFFLTSISLTIIANMGRSQKSIFEGTPARPAQTAPGEAPAPAAPGGSLFEQLQRREQQSAPAAPSSPVPPPAAPPAGGTPPQPPPQ